MRSRLIGGALLLAAAALPQQGQASSHREAPFITEMPKVDGTDFYAFNSYENGRAGYVTLIANYIPLQAAYGGPNYFTMDPDAIYEIHIDNTGDAVEDLTFQFDFDLKLGDATGNTGLTLDVGNPGATKKVSVPFTNIGAVTAANTAAQNVFETYTVKLITGDRRSGTATPITIVGGGTFKKPLDNIGTKSIADYTAYANAHIYNVSIPGCTPPAGTNPKIFVGQRREGFAVNLGQIFDVVNLDLDANSPQANPLGPMDQMANIIGGASVTSIALEVPAACLNMGGGDTIFGAWTTASVRQARVINPTAKFTIPSREGGPWVQVSRLGMPLVNEVVIGLQDKDKFNGSEPKDDPMNFADYVTNPTLPEVLELVFGGAGVRAPNNFPRTDLITAFLTGVPMVNKQSDTLAEMLRLNTAIPARAANQSPLGAATCIDRSGAAPAVNTNLPGCDAAGFPNGRRPVDDVTDISLRVAMGFLVPVAMAGSGGLEFVDGAFNGQASFLATFPYLNTPRPGAP